MTILRVKRVYDAPVPGDGFRVLVDRLWPRGLTKNRVNVDLWCKEVAPSADLRRWFGHQPERFSEFSVRYLDELDSNRAVDELRKAIGKHQTSTLVYGAKDATVNHAVVLADYLRR